MDINTDKKIRTKLLNYHHQSRRGWTQVHRVQSTAAWSQRVTKSTYRSWGKSGHKKTMVITATVKTQDQWDCSKSSRVEVPLPLLDQLKTSWSTGKSLKKNKIPFTNYWRQLQTVSLCWWSHAIDVKSTQSWDNCQKECSFDRNFKRRETMTFFTVNHLEV